MHEIGGDDFEDLVFYIYKMDEAFIKHRASKRPTAGKADG